MREFIKRFSQIDFFYYLLVRSIHIEGATISPMSYVLAKDSMKLKFCHGYQYMDFYYKITAVGDIIDCVSWMFLIYEQKHFSAKVSKQD